VPRETFEEELERLERVRSDFTAKVKKTFAEHRVFLAPVSWKRKDGGASGSAAGAPGDYGWITITRSTRPGVAFQITFWEGDPRGSAAVPTGHTDISGNLESAAKEITYMADREWNG
jgi:hypothetical protein